MKQIPKEDLINILKPYLKNSGFKKSKATWHKITDDIIFVFNIQGSQWGQEYYINLGIYLRVLGLELNPSENLCHIQTRIEHNNKTIESIIKEAMEWFDTHGSIRALKRLYIQNKLPPMTFVKVKEFLEGVDL